MSVNAFRALGRIILHRSVRVTRRRYFAHNTVHIACFSIIRCFIGQLYGLRISLHRLLCTYIVYRMDGVPLSLELDKFSSPLLEKKGADRVFFSSSLFVRKNFVGNNFHPRVSTLLNPLLIELQQLPPVFLLTFPLEMRPTVSPTLLRHRYSRFNRALSPRWSKNVLSTCIMLKKKERGKSK